MDAGAGEVWVKPSYSGSGIVNLMSSIGSCLGAEPDERYAPLQELDLALGSGPLVLIVIDGLGFRYLQEAAGGGLLARHTLGRLTSVCPSTTASAIATFMTGEAPQQHGLTGWFMYFRELGAVIAVLPFTARHGGADLTAAGYDAAELLALRPFSAGLPVPCHYVMPDHIAESPVSRAFRGPAQSHAYRDLTGFVASIERLVRRARGPAYIYAYWAEFDSCAHHFGVGSAEVGDHFRELQLSLSGMLGRLRGTGASLLVTADHGFIDSPPAQCIQLERHPVLARALRLPLCGEPRLAYLYLRPGSEEALSRYLDDLDGVAACIDSQSFLAEGWLGPGEPHPGLADRVGDRVLLLREGWQITDRLPGRPQRAHLGVHGGLSAAEMYVPLVLLQP